MSESTTTGGGENYPTGTAQRLIQRLEDAAADTLFCIEADREEAVEIAAQEIAAALAAQLAPVREGEGFTGHAPYTPVTVRSSTKIPPAGEDLAALSATPVIVGWHSIEKLAREGEVSFESSPVILIAASDLYGNDIAGMRAPTHPAAQGEPVAWAWEAKRVEGYSLTKVGLARPSLDEARNVRPLYAAPQPAATGLRDFALEPSELTAGRAFIRSAATPEHLRCSEHGALRWQKNSRSRQTLRRLSSVFRFGS